MSKISLSSEFCLGAPSVQNSPGCKSLWIQNRHEAEAAIAPFQPPSYRGETLRNDNPHTAAASQNCHRKKNGKPLKKKKKCVCVYDFYCWILVHCNRKILWPLLTQINSSSLMKPTWRKDTFQWQTWYCSLRAFEDQIWDVHCWSVVSLAGYHWVGGIFNLITLI